MAYTNTIKEESDVLGLLIEGRADVGRRGGCCGCQHFSHLLAPATEHSNSCMRKPEHDGKRDSRGSKSAQEKVGLQAPMIAKKSILTTREGAIRR